MFATYPSLRDRVAVITGGATGIGASTVEAFVRQGAQVAFLDIQTEAAQRLIQSLNNVGLHSPSYYYCDLTETVALQSTIGKIIDRFSAIDILVNNAGNDARHSMEGVTSASWDETMAVNLKHVFFMTQAVVPIMRQQSRGSIINMSSISWIIPSTNLPVYVTAKAAIVGLTRTLAHELGIDNIRVNAVLPGAILTEKQQKLWFTEEYRAEILAAQALQRMVLPEEVARLILFLASDDSSAITNQSYVIDGGWV